MINSRKQLPKYCCHKPSGQAFVRIGGKMYYLGKHGSAASRHEYDRLIAEFVANGRQIFRNNDEILIENLIVRFLDHVENERNYSKTALSGVKRVLRLLNDLYGKQSVSLFGTAALKSIRRQFLDSGLARNTINSYVGVIKQMFYWGCDEEIIPAEIGGALRMARDLQRGKTSAVDYDDIQPVEDAIVEKTLPYLSQQFQDMVRVQRRISGRPQDIFNMRLCDIDMTGDVWKYTPFTHKTKSRGKTRELPIGPKAQQILKPYIERCKEEPTQFVFPRHNVKRYLNQYGNAIESACKKAGVPKWTPNQLRHAGGAEVRDKFGLDYCQAVLGHASAKTTEIYAKVSYEKAAEVAREIG